MSTSPLAPNSSQGRPVAASSDRRRRPAVTNRRAGVVPAPDQYPTPRRDPAPAPATSRCQITVPGLASSATTVLPAGTYITPATTSGTASDPVRRPPPPPRPPGGGGKVYVHAFVSLATLPTLISVSGEYRVPARSWSYARHSCSGVVDNRCASPAVARTSPKARTAGATERAFTVSTPSGSLCTNGRKS